MLSFKPTFSLSSFTFIKRLFRSIRGLLFTFCHKGGVICISGHSDQIRSVRNVQIKMKMRHHNIPIKIAKIKKMTASNAGKYVEKQISYIRV